MPLFPQTISGRRIVRAGRLLTILLLFAVTAQSGVTTRRSWRSHLGLPDDRTTKIAQCSDGYLWIGTHGGLARFDGIKFTPMSAADLPMSGNTVVRALCTTPKGRVWAAYDN